MAPLTTLLPRRSYADAVHGRPAKPSGHSIAPLAVPPPLPVADWPRPQPNTGNTCHLAVVVQLLGASESFLQAVLNAACNPAHQEGALARLLLACADGKQPLSALADVLYGHRQQEAPGLALLLIAERLGFAPAFATQITRVCGECGELHSSECDGHGPLLLTLKEEEHNIETLLKEAVTGVQSQHPACCSWDKDREAAIEGKELTTEVVEVAPKEGVLVLQVVRQPGTMNNKDETFAKVEVPMTMGVHALVGFTVHDTGDDGSSGHWRACVKNSATGEWWLCDDEDVVLLPENSVQEIAVQGTHFFFDVKSELSQKEEAPTLTKNTQATVPPVGWQTPTTYNLGALLEAIEHSPDHQDELSTLDKKQEEVSFDEMSKICQHVAEMTASRIVLAKSKLSQTTEPLFFSPQDGETAMKKRIVFGQVRGDGMLSFTPTGGLLAYAGDVVLDMDAILYDSPSVSSSDWQASSVEKRPWSERRRRQRRQGKNMSTREAAARMRQLQNERDFDAYIASIMQRGLMTKQDSSSGSKSSTQSAEAPEARVFENCADETTLPRHSLVTSRHQIFVRLSSGKSITVDVCKDTTFAQVKLCVQQRTGIPFSEQNLFFRGRLFKDGDKLHSVGVHRNCSLVSALRLCGGMSDHEPSTSADPLTKGLCNVFTLLADPSGMRVFTMPGFQRPYRWERVNVEALLRDLWAAFQHWKFLVSNDREESKKCPPYQLNHVVLVEGTFKAGNRDSEDVKRLNDIRSYWVVDGQQRITTLMLMFIIVHSRFRTRITKDAPIPATCGKTLGFLDPIVNRDVCIIPSNREHRDTFDDLLKHSGAGTLENWLEDINTGAECEDCELLGAIVTIKKWCDGIVHETDPRPAPEQGVSDGEKLLLEFIKYVLQRCKANVLLEKDVVQALQMYVAINARGMPLSLEDQVKALLTPPKQYETSKSVIDLWEQFDQKWGKCAAQSYSRGLSNTLIAFEWAMRMTTNLTKVEAEGWWLDYDWYGHNLASHVSWWRDFLESVRDLGRKGGSPVDVVSVVLLPFASAYGWLFLDKDFVEPVLPPSKKPTTLFELQRQVGCVRQFLYYGSIDAFNDVPEWRALVAWRVAAADMPGAHNGGIPVYDRLHSAFQKEQIEREQNVSEDGEASDVFKWRILRDFLFEAERMAAVGTLCGANRIAQRNFIVCVALNYHPETDKPKNKLPAWYASYAESQKKAKRLWEPTFMSDLPSKWQHHASVALTLPFLHSSRRRFMLLRLDVVLQQDDPKKGTTIGYNLNDFHVEHVFPQHPDVKNFDAFEERGWDMKSAMELMNRLGNLCILPPDLNIKIGNGAYEHKLKAIQDFFARNPGHPGSRFPTMRKQFLDAPEPNPAMFSDKHFHLANCRGGAGYFDKVLDYFVKALQKFWNLPDIDEPPPQDELEPEQEVIDIFAAAEETPLPAAAAQDATQAPPGAAAQDATQAHGAQTIVPSVQQQNVPIAPHDEALGTEVAPLPASISAVSGTKEYKRGQPVSLTSMPTRRFWVWSNNKEKGVSFVRDSGYVQRKDSKYLWLPADSDMIQPPKVPEYAIIPGEQVALKQWPTELGKIVGVTGDRSYLKFSVQYNNKEIGENGLVQHNLSRDLQQPHEFEANREMAKGSSSASSGDSASSSASLNSNSKKRSAEGDDSPAKFKCV